MHTSPNKYETNRIFLAVNMTIVLYVLSLIQIRITELSAWEASSLLPRKPRLETTSGWCILMEVFAPKTRQGSKLSWLSSANQVFFFFFLNPLLLCFLSYVSATFDSFAFLFPVLLQEISIVLLSFLASHLMSVFMSWSGTQPPPASSRRRRETTARWRTLKLVWHAQTTIKYVWAFPHSFLIWARKGMEENKVATGLIEAFRKEKMVFLSHKSINKFLCKFFLER